MTLDNLEKPFPSMLPLPNSSSRRSIAPTHREVNTALISLIDTLRVPMPAIKTISLEP